MTQLEECRKAIEQICMRQNDCWHDTKTIATAVYVILTHMVEADRKTEPQISPSDCATCKHNPWSTPRTCGKCVGQKDGKPSMYEPKTKPQTERSSE